MGEYNRTSVFVRLLSAKTRMRKRNFIENVNVKKVIIYQTRKKARQKSDKVRCGRNVKLQKQRKMEKILLSQFASQFAEASLTSFVESFNAQVGNRGFNSARAAHDHALIDELVRRGVDVSAISDGHSISFAHHVALDESAMKLVIQN